MAKDSELAKLRALALKRQRAVQNKMSRLKTKRDADTFTEIGPILRGTEYDPLKDRSQINRYTKSQLRSHIDRLNEFLDRRNQFVGLGDENRTPVPIDVWREYKSDEAARNAMVREHRAGVDSLFIAPQGMTVAEREEWIANNRAAVNARLRRDGKNWTLNPAVNSEEVYEREPFSLTSVTGLRKLMESTKKKLEAGYDERQREAAQEQFIAMMDRVGEEVLGYEVMDLTPGQFDLLWHNTSFATMIGTIYELLKKQAKGKGNAAKDQVIIDSSLESAVQLVEWAKRQNR